MWNTKRLSLAAGRTSKSSYRHSFLVNQHARDIEFQYFITNSENEYPPWWTREGFLEWFHDLPDNTLWISYVCSMALLAIIWVTIGFEGITFEILDVIYNVTYAIHVFALGYYIVCEWEASDVNSWTVCSFLVDLGSFSHYVNSSKTMSYKLVCYYLRLHRPFRYLWALNDYNLKGSVLGTTLKYWYIFMVLRISWGLLWLHVESPSHHMNANANENETEAETVPLTPIQRVLAPKPQQDSKTMAFRFLNAFYMVNKMLIPIGPTEYPANDEERVLSLMVMICGCIVVTGVAVAALSLVISLYMRPEETFRSRYRLILKEMKESNIPQHLVDKVTTFYKMYWLKQRAVSATELLPTFPPTLPATIYAEIYFEFTQKSRILRDLSYQFLSELSKKIDTVKYIPGDYIIKRSSKKAAIIYITYGDIEMLTAEDDNTPILRMTRGTMLSPDGCIITSACGPSHIEITAATFVIAHVLKAGDLWRVILKHSTATDHAPFILSVFNEHLEKVKKHYESKAHLVAKHKSSILLFKRNLMALKEAKNAKGESMLARTDLLLDIAGYYLMRNRKDSSLADEADKICLRPTFPCILQPNSSLQVVWHTFVAMLILIVSITHPYYLIFMPDVPLEFRFFDYVVTVVYCLDLIVHLSTGANVEEGVPITFSQTSSQQCRNHWFVLDVLGTLPIFEFIGNGHFAGMNKLLRLPKVFRVLKSMEETYRTNVLRFLTYTLLFLIACYLVAAVQQSFMCYQFDTCMVTNFTHPPFWTENALSNRSNVIPRLTYGLYWSISMITFTTHKQEAIGRESWSNIQRILRTIIVLEISIVMRIFMEAVYSATIMVTTSLREDYDGCIETVKSFLIRNQVDPVLRQRFINYLQLSWYTDMAYSMTHMKNSIFYDLPPHVYQDIVARQRIKYIQGIPFMTLLKKSEMKTVASQARLFYTSPNEILLNTGDLSNEMYVIKQGICEVLDPESKAVVGTLTIKHNFGVVSCLLRLPSFYTIRTVTHVQVFSIARKHLLDALETPQLRDALEFAKEQPEYKLAQIRRQPFLAYEPPAPTPNTERFRLPRKHEADYDFLHPFTRLGFLSILRYIFPRFTIRPDGKYLYRCEWFRAICAILSSTIFPSYTYLVLQWPWLYYVATLLDLSAWFDIFQRMLIGYYNERGILVYHPSSTAAHYLKGAFISDLLACLPLENLEAKRSGSGNNANKYLVTPTKQFLMLNRLLQMYRLQGVLVALSNFIDRRDIILVLHAIPIFWVILNVLTCFMVFYSVKIYYWDENLVTKWLIVPFNDVGGSWIQLFHKAFRFNMTETPWNLHLAVHFWMVYEATSTGYNVFNPTNFKQMEVLFIGMACSAMVHTYFSVRIISVRANVNKALATFQEHMQDIMVYMRRENFDTDLQKEVQQYYEHRWDKMGGIDYRGVLKLCDQITLRTDAILHIYGPTFARCPILSVTDVSLLRTLGRSVNSEYFLRGMQIIQQDDVISDMYFVDYGMVDVRIALSDRSLFVKLPRGSVFGNLEPLTTDRCPMSLVAMSRAHLLMIKSRAFYHIVADFPTTMELLNTYRMDNKYYVMGNVLEQQKMKRQRITTSASIARGRRGLFKQILFKDRVVNMYLMIICLTSIYADVYNAGFQDNRFALILALYILDVCFYLKILMQFIMPYLVDSSDMKKMLILIRMAYFKGVFWYDIASCIPFELLSFLSEKHSWLIFSWLRLNRTLRIVTVYNCLKSSNDRITVNLILSTIFSVFTWFTLFVHSTSCLWYFMGLMQDQVHPNSSWIWTDDNKSLCYDSYICSLYFVITTFTQNGVGDIVPKNHAEVVFVSLLQVLSTLVYMVYVGEFSNLIQYHYFRSFTFYGKYMELQKFLQNNRVSKNLVSLVNRYSLHIWQESRGLQIPHFLKIAPHALRLRIMSAAYIHHLDRHHIFEDCEPAFLRQLVGCLRLYTYNSGMYVVKESEITNAMYLIHTGKVKETANSEDTPTGLSSRVYPTGSYFGVLQGLIRDTPYSHSYETLSKAQVLTLLLQDWEYLLAHFPLSKAVIHHNMKHVGGSDLNPDQWPGGSGMYPKPRTGMSFLDTDSRPPRPPGGGFGGGGIATSDHDHDNETAHQTDKDTEEQDKDEIEAQKYAALLAPRRPSMKLTGSIWPLDSRNADAGSPGDDAPANVGASTSTQKISGPMYIDDDSKSTFMDKFKTSAKKLMGATEIDLGYDPGSSAVDGQDALTFAEDEATTAALIKQYEKRDEPETIEDIKDLKPFKVEFREPGSAENIEKLEEHLVTVDMNERKLKVPIDSNSPPRLGLEGNIAMEIPMVQLEVIKLNKTEEITRTESRTNSEIIEILTKIETKPKVNLPTKIEALNRSEPESATDLPTRKTADFNLIQYPYRTGRDDDDDEPMKPTIEKPRKIPEPYEENQEPSSSINNRHFVEVRYDEENDDDAASPPPRPPHSPEDEDTASVRDRRLEAYNTTGSEIRLLPRREEEQEKMERRAEETETTTTSVTQDRQDKPPKQ